MTRYPGRLPQKRFPFCIRSGSMPIRHSGSLMRLSHHRHSTKGQHGRDWSTRSHLAETHAPVVCCPPAPPLPLLATSSVRMQRTGASERSARVCRSVPEDASVQHAHVLSSLQTWHNACTSVFMTITMCLLWSGDHERNGGSHSERVLCIPGMGRGWLDVSHRAMADLKMRGSVVTAHAAEGLGATHDDSRRDQARGHRGLPP
jgi:hypothetical protein